MAKFKCLPNQTLTNRKTDRIKDNWHYLWYVVEYQLYEYVSVKNTEENVLFI